jgi:hypothetical protein
MLHDVIFYTLFFAVIIYWVCKDDIRTYFWNKKSPEEKHNAFQAEACRQDPSRPFYKYHVD